MKLLREKGRSPSLYGAISSEFAATFDSLSDSVRAQPWFWRETNIPVLATAFLASLTTGGPTYAFGLYGSTLKATLHLTQSQLDTLSSASFCAGLFSCIPGLLVDRWGVRSAMGLGAITMSLALTGYWLVASQFITLPQAYIVPVLSLLGVVTFMTNSMVVGSLFKGLVVSCGVGSRGSAVGAAKGYLGLGAGVFSLLFDAVRHNNVSDLYFLPMAACFALFAIALPAFSLLPGPATMGSIVDASSPLHFKVIYSGLAMLICLVLWTSASFMFRPIAETMDNEDAVSLDQESHGNSHALKALLILLAWIVPILSLFCLPQKRQVPKYSQINSFDLDEEEAIGAGDELFLEDNGGIFPKCTDKKLSEMLRTVPAWLFLWTCTILVGSGTMMTNNMGQMVESRGFSRQAVSSCLALFSVSQGVARILVGEVSERALTWKTRIFGIERGVPRPVFLVIASLFAVLGHATLAEATTRPAFVIGIIFSGFAFGCTWPLMVLVVGDIFGTTNHGANYLFYDGFTSAVGTLVISKYIVQMVYESHIDPNDDNMTDTTCYGLSCFRQSQQIVTGLCLTCLVTSVVMVRITRESYGRPVR